MNLTSNLVYPSSIQNIERNTDFDNALACLRSAGIRDQHILDIYMKHYITPSRALRLTSAVSKTIDLTDINDVVEEVRNHLQHLSPLEFAIQYHRHVIKKAPNISGLWGYIEKSILHIQHQAEKEKLLIVDTPLSLLSQCKSDNAEIVFTYTNSGVCQTIQQDQISNECTISTWDCIEDWAFNRCIAFAFGGKNQVLETVSHLTAKCPENTVVHIVAPNTLWDDAKIRVTLCGMLALQKLVLIDPAAVPENPKKWCIATLINSTLDTPTQVNLLDLKLNGDGTQLHGDKYIAVPYQTFQVGTVSIKKLHSIYTMKKPPRSKAEIVEFSQELLFYKTFYKENDQFRMQITFRGSEQTFSDEPTQEKQLARYGGPLRNTEDEACVSLSTLLFQDNAFAMTVRQYANNLLAILDISIKTCWFIFYPTISKMSRYNHKLMLQMMDSQDSVLSKLTANSTPEAVFNAVNCFCCPDQNQEPVLAQLQLIYQQLLRLTLITHNPVSAMLKQVTREKKSLENTRRRIKAGTLSTTQEIEMFRLLHSEQAEPFLALGGEIITNSPLAVAEVCGLTWANYTYDKSTNLGLLYITQRADRSGALLPVERPWFFPLPDVLCDKINGIYSELKKNPEFDPQNTFIVHRYKDDGKHPAFTAMNDYLQNLLCQLPSYDKILTIEGDTPIEVNIYELTSRILKETFLSHCEAEAAFTKDEIRYLSGKLGETVAGKNYEDPGTLYSLSLIRQHLNIAITRRNSYV